ncbi:hypothetical protein EWM64_g7894 [Hericium alpestre]|uniref:Uncharacterized protein n=1 Tax=Hericium alpestre TaxID=135208 RepID=A0A4Y9ZPY3_9AGAM|nr:hypothetical protein EWM64_g7894 [Hericium alpestre]
MNVIKILPVNATASRYPATYVFPFSSTHGIMATSSSKSKRKRADSGGNTCPICHQPVKAKGMGAHKKACAKRKKLADDMETWEESVGNQIEEDTIRSAHGVNRGLATENVAGPSFAPEVDVGPSVMPDPFDAGPAITVGQDEPDIIAEPDVLGQDQDVQLDDIRMIYHPSSGKATETKRFEEYGRAAGNEKLAAESLSDPEPWKPFFPSLQDFNFAEVALDGNLTREQCERLITIINTCVQGRDTFNMKNYADLVSMWQRASEKLTGIQTTTIAAPWDGEDQEFEMHFRLLWDWVTDLLQDPRLAPHFVWDARKMFKFNGQSFIRFVDEPWTANDFWDVQSKLPEGAKPLCFLLYADKSQLSSFGTEKGYPMIACCANLPVEIRNGNGLGGGRVVGWLPVVPEDASKSGTKHANFKRVIWHKAFYELLESIESHSKTGCWFQCADGVTRHLFPCIIILSADLEEQCIMVLTRGFKSKCPCPVCLVKPEELSDLTQSYEARTATKVQETIAKARAARTRKDAEVMLKAEGLRDIDNVFWKINNSDPYHALSFDRMHAYNGGLFEDHLWEIFKEIIHDMGSGAAAAFEQRMARMPSWSELTRFKNVLSVTFSDAGKYEDIGKIIVFGAYGSIKQDRHSPAWALLRCLRSFSILDTYMAFEVHTEETIAAGRQELQKFGELVMQYRALTPVAEKNWDFPKMHWHLHSFDSIEEKGATRTFNTKPNEKLHGPLRKFYLRQTNKKDVGPQILKLDHCDFIAKYFRECMAHAEEQAAAAAARDADDSDEISAAITRKKKSRRFFAENIIFGSQRPSCSFEDLEAKQFPNTEDTAIFKQFRKRLATWLTASFPNYGIPLPDGPRGVVFDKTDTIQEYQLLKVTYESMVDWRAKTDYLRCSPLFHGSPRRDFVIVDMIRGNIFGQLLFMFTPDGSTCLRGGMQIFVKTFVPNNKRGLAHLCGGMQILVEILALDNQNGSTCLHSGMQIFVLNNQDGSARFCGGMQIFVKILVPNNHDRSLCLRRGMQIFVKISASDAKCELACIRDGMQIFVKTLF